jgi:antitoxin component HigA of HigAB toxin-antitoxin module
MKKKLLFTLAFLSASVFTFAQEVTSGDGNVTYTYTEANPTKVISSGTESTTTDDQKPYLTDYKSEATLHIHHDVRKKVAGREREYAGTISEIKNYDNLVLEDLNKYPEDIVENEKNVNISKGEFLKLVKNSQTNKYEYQIQDLPEAQEIYAAYLEACGLVKSDLNLVLGSKAEEKYDVKGRTINDDLYYQEEEIEEGIFEYEIVCNITGIYKEIKTFENCKDIVIPTTIGEGIDDAKVNEVDSVAYVTGLIDDNRVKTKIAEYAENLNFDFTNSTVVGKIRYDAPSNKLVYFADGVDAEGVNIVSGSNCENYNLADDGTEVKVYKAFNAKNIDYTRNISAGKYYTITVPFDFTRKSKYFDRTSIFTSCNVKPGSDPLVTFTTTDTWEANMPMLCKANATTSVMSLSSTQGIEVTVTEPISWSSDANSNEPAKFNGTYKPVAKEDLTKAYIVGLDGTFGRMPVNSTRLKPCRAYITLDNESSAAKYDNATIQIVDEDGTVEILETSEEATGIDGVTDGANAEVTNSQFVSVDGKVSTTPVKGLNIVKSTLKNGKTSTKKVVY